MGRFATMPVTLRVALGIAIVGVPAVLVTLFWVPDGRNEQGLIASVRLQITNFRQAIAQYDLDHRRLPPTLSELTQTIPTLDEPYLPDPTLPRDPWDQEFVYRIVDASKREYVISSNGDDRLAGTEDDIVWSTVEGFR